MRRLRAPFFFLVVFVHTMKSVKGQRSRGKKGFNFEEAMNEAFSEIFQNLKFIEEDTKKQKKEVDLRRRRISAPAATLRQTTEVFRKPKQELGRKFSTPTPMGSTLPSIHWVLQCFDEEDDLEMVNFNLDSSTI